MKKILLFICFVLAFNAKAISKETTYDKELFNKSITSFVVPFVI